MSHQPWSASTLTSPKWGSDAQICDFSKNIDTTLPLKVCCKVSLSKNFQLQSCSAINYLLNGINILAGGDPVPVKCWPKLTLRKDARLTFHTRCAVQSASRHSCRCWIKVKVKREIQLFSV